MGWCRAWLVAMLPACSFEVQLVAADARAVSACTFSVTIGGSSSTYLLSSDLLSWRLAEASCESLNAHLFVPDTDAEADAMRGKLTGDKRWVGIAQPFGQASPTAGWVRITGGDVTTRWANGKPDEAGGPETGGEQAGSLAAGGFDDDDHHVARPYICECDGIAVMRTTVEMLPP